MIIGPAKSPDEPGIYKPASDVVVVGKKLYVGEEDSMDETIDQGYVSIWDISDPKSPKFIKRLKAGKELPADCKLAHEIYGTIDGRYVYAQSWASGHLVKIDGVTDEVIGVVSADVAGWHMPHGNFVPGKLR